MGISLCMIVKNEEDWLPGAVESVRSIVDEVIIVDTGSTDATADRASALDAKLLKIQWKDSFAEARNVSLAQATQPWILVLDADERLAPRDLLYIKDATRGDADGYHLIQRNYVNGQQVLAGPGTQTDYEEGSRYPGICGQSLNPAFQELARNPLSWIGSRNHRSYALTIHSPISCHSCRHSSLWKSSR